MLANREGTFNAHVIELGVDETGPNHLATVAIQVRLYEERAEAEWVDCSGESLEITGWFYLEKKDGSLNERTVQSLKSALGWDGRDPFWLQDNVQQITQQPVQVKLAFEEFNGATNLRVQYLNPYGYEGGGVSRADDDTRKSIQRRIGSKLRAMAGGTPAAAPKPAGTPADGAKAAKPAAPAAGAAPAPAGKPTPAPAPKPAAPKPPAPAAPPRPPAPPHPAAPEPPAPGPATMEEAWEAFCGRCTPPPEGKWTQEAIEAEWFRIIAELFPGRQPDQLTPAEWGRMKAEGIGMILPF